VLAAILTIGPVAITASMFPRSARLALAAPNDLSKAVALRILHRITHIYTVVGVLVPVFGLATGASMGILGDSWLVVSMILTAVAAAMLIVFILPGQNASSARLTSARTTRSSPCPMGSHVGSRS
jgi:hypothetical protein